MRYHWIMTLQKTQPGGAVETQSTSGIINLPRRTSRYEAVPEVIDLMNKANPHMTGGVILFYSLERDRL